MVASLLRKRAAEVADDLVIEIVLIHRSFIEVDDLIRGKDHWRAMLEYTHIGKGLYHQFWSDSVQVADRYAYYWLLLGLAHH